MVPLTIPKTFVISVAARLSWITRMTGTTPATAASKRSWTPASRAASKSSSPCWAMSCLLAVTTWRPAAQRRAARSRGPARCRRSARPRSPSRSRMFVEVALGAPQDAGDLGTPSRRRPRPGGPLGDQARGRRPTDRAHAEQADSCAGAHRTSIAHQVLVGLATHDQPRVALAAEDDRRPRHAVVVVGHRVPVGAGGRGHQDVARARSRRASRRVRSGCRPTRSACRRPSRSCPGGRRRGWRSSPRSASRRASGAGCRTCRRRPRR